MSKNNSFENLFIWKKSRELVNLIYQISNDWNDFALKNQIRRASVSVLSNIAEGFERGSKKEFIQYLFISKGSCGEVRAQLYVAIDQSFIDGETFKKASKLATHESRLISKFIKGYKEKGLPGEKYK